MAGLVPAIHVLQQTKKDVDARHEAGHDDVEHRYLLPMMFSIIVECEHVRVIGGDRDFHPMMLGRAECLHPSEILNGGSLRRPAQRAASAAQSVLDG
jgi:hypothetical protein